MSVGPAVPCFQEFVVKSDENFVLEKTSSCVSGSCPTVAVSVGRVSGLVFWSRKKNETGNGRKYIHEINENGQP